MVHVVPHTLLVMVEVARVAIGEANAGWLINPQNSCMVGPRVGICDFLQPGFCPLDRAGAVLIQQREHAAASGTACQPENKWGFRRIFSCFKHPVKVVLVRFARFIDLEISRALLHIAVAEAAPHIF
eukprot:1303288-Pleurochrysis_carterae.AAC.4